MRNIFSRKKTSKNDPYNSASSGGEKFKGFKLNKNKPFSEKSLSSKNKKVTKSEYEEKVDKIIDSVALLFKPFKDIMINVIPKSKGIIKLLDLFAILIAKITKFIVMKWLYVVGFLKSIYFKILVIIFILLFLLGAVVSRFVNSETYITSLEKAILKSTGYNASINGKLKLSFVPSLVIIFENVTFYNDDLPQQSADSFQIKELSANKLIIDFKILPLILGNLKINEITLQGAVIDIKTSDKTKLSHMIYDNLIAKVEKNIQITTNNTLINNSSGALNGIITSFEQPNTLSHNKDSSTLETFANKEDGSSEESTNLITSKKTPSKIEQGILGDLFVKLVNSISFELEKIDKIEIKRSQINIINQSRQKLFIVDNIEALLTSSVVSGMSAEGGFRFAEENMRFSLILKHDEASVLIDSKISLASSPSKLIHFVGVNNKEDNLIFGNLVSENMGALFFINKFLINTDIKEPYKDNFVAKLELNSNYFALKDINVAINNDVYSGSFVWDFSEEIKGINLDLKVKVEDISPFISQIKSDLEGSIIKGSTFLSLNEKILNWKNSKINFFKSNNFVFNLEINDSKANTEVVDLLKIGLLLNNFNKLYIYDFNLKTEGGETKALGKIDLDSNTALFSLQSQGKLSNAINMTGFPRGSATFIQNVALEDAYQFSSKVRFETNKVLFFDIIGIIGKIKLKDSYMILTQRINDNELFIKTKLDTLDFITLSDIYSKQTRSVNYSEGGDIDLFGLGKNLKVNLDIIADNFNIKGLLFKDSNIEISLLPSGFSINRFIANGDKGGSVIASLSADSIVTPAVAGHINFDNLVIKFENIKQIAFKETDLIGNVVLNGRVKFIGDNYSDPFSKIDGEISFIKQERINVNRFANIDGLYTTLTEKQFKGKTTFFINDIYGKAYIKNNIIELYPIAMLYIYNNSEFRGMAQAIFNLKTQELTVDGTADNSTDINKKLSFTLSGDILNPKVKRNFFKGDSTSLGVKKPKEKDVLRINEKTHKISDNLNNSKSKDNFNNTYNSNVGSNKYRALKDDLYEQDVEDNSKGDLLPHPEKGNIPKTSPTIE